MWARPALDYSSHRHYSEPVCRGVTFLMNPGEEGNIIAQKAGESGCGCRALCTVSVPQDDRVLEMGVIYD